LKGISKTVSDLHINEEMLKDASKRLKIKPFRILSLSNIQNFFTYVPKSAHFVAIDISTTIPHGISRLYENYPLIDKKKVPF